MAGKRDGMIDTAGTFRHFPPYFLSRGQRRTVHARIFEKLVFTLFDDPCSFFRV